MDFDFEFVGSSNLLMHADDVDEADRLIAWRKDPKNKSVSVPGDDRSPAWTWQTYLYHDGTHLAMPQECIMAALRYAGAKIQSKGKSTFKAMSQSGLLIPSEFCEFLSNGKPIAIRDIKKFENASFADHVKACRGLGFDLLKKRAKVGNKKHLRVRPMFGSWSVRGRITVNEPAITEDILKQLFEIAGRLAGLGDWRPSAPEKPGHFGMFTSSVTLARGMRKTG